MGHVPLDYAGAPSASTSRPAAAGRARTAYSEAATAIASSICLVIEWLNYRSGSPLPQQPDDGPWRIGSGTEATLRDVVGSFGLLQYPLVVVTLLVACSVALDPRCARRRRLVALCCVPLLLATGAAAVHRGYFSSILD